MSLEELFDTNGWELAEVAGDVRYVSRDNSGRAVFGPRRRGARGWMAMMHGPRQKPTARPQTEAEATIMLPSGEEVGVAVASAHDAAEPWRARWARRLKDREWHRAVQHTAVDIAMWSSLLALSAVALKAAWFVVAL